MGQAVTADPSTGVSSGLYDRRKAQWFLRLFGLTKVPLIGLVRARIVTVSPERTVVCIPLRRRTKNHLGSMYFGALAIGADVAAGTAAMLAIETLRRETGTRLSLVFKDMEGRFLRRPEGDVHFASDDGAAVEALVAEAARTGARVERKVRVVATVPDVTGPEPVAEFVLTLSLKRRD